jgi:hypothetical protein
MRLSSLTSTLLPLLAGAALCSSAQAQNRGPISSLASGLSLESEPGSTGSADPLLLKAPQVQSSPPHAFSTMQFSSGPDFTPSAMFGALSSLVEIDAHSSGNAIIPAPDNDGVPDLAGAGSWMGVIVSVREDNNGDPVSGLQNTPVRAAAANGRDVRSDLFSHYLANSVGLSASMGGRSFLEQTREDMGFSAAPNPNIDALDLGLGVNRFAAIRNSTRLFAVDDFFYFSLTEASSVALANTNFAGPITVPDPCAIYLIEWQDDGQQPPSWTTPLEWRSRAELNLVVGDNVDALEVAKNNSCVIISTQLVPGRSQLQIQKAPGDPLQALKGREATGNTYLVTEKIGVIDDVEDIDAVCILEPERHIYGSHFGTPTDHSLGVSNDFGLSVTRQDPAFNPDIDPDRLELQVSGWGGLPPEPAYVFFLGTHVDSPLVADWQVLGRGTRMKTDEVFGISVPITVPPGPGANLQIVGLQFDANGWRLTEWSSTIYLFN